MKKLLIIIGVCVLALSFIGYRISVDYSQQEKYQLYTRLITEYDSLAEREEWEAQQDYNKAYQYGAPSFTWLSNIRQSYDSYLSQSQYHLTRATEYRQMANNYRLLINR